MIHIIGMYREGQATGMSAAKAKVFWTGRSQAVRLPKEFRFDTETVSVRREGTSVILEPVDEWPEGYVESFTGVPEDFRRPEQGQIDEREKLG
jgi:antitoxin VapB